MDYEVLSPTGEVDVVKPRGLQPRVTDLKGKTIGLFAFYKFYGPTIMAGVEEVLKERFPNAKFSHYHQGDQDPSIAEFKGPLPLIDTELLNDDRYKEGFINWIKSVDTVVSGHGD